MGDLSENFSRREFACKCGCGYDGINLALVEVLQRLRNTMRQPIQVNSGCRCVNHNMSVGGVQPSEHMKGNAADITCEAGAVFMFLFLNLLYETKRIPNLEFCQLYREKNFVHVDVGRIRNKRFSEAA
jgi:uncharacterized protein YcbK (DUF882 family)